MFSAHLLKARNFWTPYADNNAVMNPWHPILVISTVAYLFTLGCGGDDDKPAAGPVVMVIDDGFDTSLELFEGKILAAKAVECRDNDGEADPSDDRRTRFLAYLKKRDDACSLVDGLGDKEDQLGDFASHRANWNAMVELDESPSRRFSKTTFDELGKGFDRALSEPSHGTATAGVVARNNPGVKLVLVERSLLSASEMSEFPCIQQANVDAEVELLKDEEIRQAIIDQPSSLIDEQIAELQRAHKVRIVNESFGRLPREALEKLQADNDCPAVDLQEVFELEAELFEKWAKLNPPPDVLTVKAAGNSNVEVNGLAEHADCSMSDGLITVGSHKRGGSRSEFSNFGACVDVFAPGERVIAPLTGGWLLPLSGTSFSAPLVVRWLTLQKDLSLKEEKQLKREIVKLRNDNKQLPADLFPNMLTYDPSGSIQALKVAGESEAILDGRRLQVRTRVPKDLLRSPILAPLFWRMPKGQR